MKIPADLCRIYSDDHHLVAFVNQCLAKVSAHIDSNKMVFFPEYTDHSVRHLEEVLQTAWDFATVESKKIFTPFDAVALIAGVCLHDFGMYLTKDGFQSLISPSSKWKGIPGLDSKSWHDLWIDFMSEASRFDGKKLLALFGDNYRPARPIPTGGDAWDEFDFFLVGEFIRKHHARLAHEIAIYGLPSIGGNSVPIFPENYEYLSDISGLIARSHWMDLRDSADYLILKYGNRVNPRKINAIYLMGLL